MTNTCRVSVSISPAPSSFGCTIKNIIGFDPSQKGGYALIGNISALLNPGKPGAEFVAETGEVIVAMFSLCAPSSGSLPQRAAIVAIVEKKATKITQILTFDNNEYTIEIANVTVLSFITSANGENVFYKTGKQLVERGIINIVKSQSKNRIVPERTVRQATEAYDRWLPLLPSGWEWAGSIGGVLFVARNENHEVQPLIALGQDISKLSDPEWVDILGDQADKTSVWALSLRSIASMVEASLPDDIPF